MATSLGSSWTGIQRLAVCVKGLQLYDVPGKLCEDYAMSVSCTSDEGLNLTAECMEKMLTVYVIQHRISSVGKPPR